MQITSAPVSYRARNFNKFWIVQRVLNIEYLIWTQFGHTNHHNIADQLSHHWKAMVNWTLISCPMLNKGNTD